MVCRAILERHSGPREAHARSRTCLSDFWPWPAFEERTQTKSEGNHPSKRADSFRYFKEVVKQNTGVTSREQSEIWLKQLQNRKRKPIRQSYAVTIQGALDKWILPAIGELPLANVDNLSVKPLIEKMSAAGLSPRTVNKYIEHVKQVVESLKSPNGEPVHNRKWDPETMDLPVVEQAEQKRPSLKADTISKLIQASSGQEQALYILLAATGLRFLRHLPSRSVISSMAVVPSRLSSRSKGLRSHREISQDRAAKRRSICTRTS